LLWTQYTITADTNQELHLIMRVLVVKSSDSSVLLTSCKQKNSGHSNGRLTNSYTLLEICSPSAKSM